MPIHLKEHNIAPYQKLRKKVAISSKILLVSATGTGKTYLAGKLAEDSGWTNPGDVLILVPKNAAAIAWRNVLPEADVLTYQGLLFRRPYIGGYKIIITDEAHHLGADNWGAVFDFLTKDFHGLILGLTATPVRYLDSQKDVSVDFFDGNKVAGVQLPQAIDEGILPAFDYVTALYNVPKWKRKPDKFTETLYSRFDFLANEYSCRNILKKHLRDGKPHRVAVFVDSIAGIQEAMDLCSSVFPDAKNLIANSRKSKKQNYETYREFENEEGTAFLYVVDILNEGIHLKGIDTEIMFRKTKSPAVYLQQLGRVLDTGNTNTRVTIFDFVANHMNLREYGRFQEGTIRWLSENIRPQDRQIIQYDYALEQVELADKIQALENGGWISEEDDLLRRYYNSEDGLSKLEELLSHRSRSAISSRALRLGIAPPRDFIGSEELREDIRTQYGKEGYWDFFKKKYPGIKRSSLASMANRMGVTAREKREYWSPEEDEILRNNKDMPTKKLTELLPGRSKSSINGRRHSLGIKSRKNHVWTQTDLDILAAHPELTNRELQTRFFPGLTESMVQRKRQAIGLSTENRWSEEKIAAFKSAYEKGGRKAVRALPEFANMTDTVINGAAHRYNCKCGRSTNRTWTEEEKDLCRKWLDTPEEKRPPRSELNKQIPAHSANGIKDMLRRLSK